MDAKRQGPRLVEEDEVKGIERGKSEVERLLV